MEGYMTGRERILNTFRGEKVDRMPVCPWIYSNLAYKYFNIPPGKQRYRDGKHDLVEQIIEVTDYYGFDHMHRVLSLHDAKNSEKSSNDGKWQVEVENKIIDGKDTEITSIKTPEKTLRQVREFVQLSPYTKVQAKKEYFIKDKDDFYQFLKFQPSFEEAVYPTLTDQYEDIGKARKLLGNRGVVVCGSRGSFNITALNYRNYEVLMLDPYTDPGFYKEMMEYFTERAFDIYKKDVEHGADIIELGANLATSAVGEEFYREFVLEYEKKHVDRIHELGAYVLLHNCGDADKIMHIYNEMGIDAWGYLTPPPYGDVNLDKALEVMNKDMVLVGNIDQVEFMIKATPDEVRQKVKVLAEKVKPRGNFILSSTDWFFDDTPDANLKAFAEAGKEYGLYE